MGFSIQFYIFGFSRSNGWSIWLKFKCTIKFFNPNWYLIVYMRKSVCVWMVGCTAAAPSLSSAVNKKKIWTTLDFTVSDFVIIFKILNHIWGKNGWYYLVDTKPFKLRFFLADFPWKYSHLIHKKGNKKFFAIKNYILI